MTAWPILKKAELKESHVEEFIAKAVHPQYLAGHRINDEKLAKAIERDPRIVCRSWVFDYLCLLSDLANHRPISLMPEQPNTDFLADDRSRYLERLQNHLVAFVLGFLPSGFSVEFKPPKKESEWGAGLYLQLKKVRWALAAKIRRDPDGAFLFGVKRRESHADLVARVEALATVLTEGEMPPETARRVAEYAVRSQRASLPRFLDAFLAAWLGVETPKALKRRVERMHADFATREVI
jgi:hypothetical protein